jgi:HEAT repeat protein
MRRRLVTLVLAALMMIPAMANGEVYFAFSAEQMDYQGQQRIFFVPFSFTAQTHRQIERKIAVLFEKLHSSRQAIYGETFLLVKEKKGEFAATLHLDPAVVRFHDIIVGEIYLTLSTIGVDDLSLAETGKQVTDAAVKYPYFIPTIPLWEALPPATFFHSLIRLGPNQYVESDTYLTKMAAKDPALYEAILGLLKAEDAYIRLTVLKAFPHLAIPDENSKLIPMLSDPELVVVYKAIELLSKKSDPVVLDALAKVADDTKDTETKLQCARILVANNRSHYQIYILFEQLKSQDAVVVVKTIQKLAASGDKRVLPALVRMLLHKNQDVRQAGFEALKQLRDLETLKGLLSTPEIDASYRMDAALELMRQSEAPYSVEGIAYLIRNHVGEPATEAITTIEMRSYKDQAPVLVEALIHRDEQVAIAAVAAIGKLELVDLLPKLSQASQKKGLNTIARDTIAKLLSTLKLRVVMKKAKSRDIVIRELAVLALVKEAKAKAAEQLDIEPILDLLGEAMKDDNIVIKRAAVQAIHEIGGKRNWRRLLRMKKDKDPDLRIIVGQAALALENEDGDGVILELLADENDKVRIEAIRAIRKRKITSALGKLKFMVESRDENQNTEALRTIVALNETEDDHKEFYEIYKKLIFEQNPEIQLLAVQGIQWIVDPMVVPLLQSGILLMHKDERIRAATLMALGRSKDHNVVEHIARGFADGSLPVQEGAIEGLRLMGHKKGILPLQEYIKQSDDENLIIKAKDALQELETKPKGLLD